MRTHFSGALVTLTAALLLVTACSGADPEASTEPETETEAPASTETLTFIVPYAPGGGTDALARRLAPLLEEELGRSVVVMNQPDGSTVPALNDVLADTEGNTVVFEGTIIAGMEPLEIADLGPSDFAAVGIAQADSVAIAVGGESEYQTIDDLISAANAAPDTIRAATSVAGGYSHAAATQLANEGLPIALIPVPGGAANQITELLGGRLEVVISSPAELGQFVEAGDVRILAIGADERLASYPDVPTIAEAGLAENVVRAFRVVLMSPEAPAATREALESALLSAVESDDFQSFLEESGFESFVLNGDEADAFLQQEADVYRSIYGTS